MLKRKNVFCGEAMERVIIVNRTDDAPVKLRQWIAAAINITLMKMKMIRMMRLRMMRMMVLMITIVMVMDLMMLFMVLIVMIFCLSDNDGNEDKARPLLAD